MKKVLHYVGMMNRGGMEMFIMNMYRNINRQEFQFDFAVHSAKQGDLDAEIKTLGGTIHVFPAFRTSPQKYRKAWREFWHTHAGEYTAFHFHTNSLANMVALEEATKAGVTIRIVHSHSTYANKGKLQRLNDILHVLHRRKLKRCATHLFACSSDAAQWMFGGIQYADKKVVIMKNGVECTQFAFRSDVRQERRRELGIDEKKVVGHIGKFLPVKNHSFIVDVLAEMIKHDKNVVGLLLGDGPLQAEIAEKIDHLGLKDNIILLGSRNDVNELLMAMDLYIMPSLYEGFAIASLEAQLSGVPVLLSDTIPKEIQIKENVHRFSLNEPIEAWAKKAFEVLDNERITDNTAIINAGYDVMNTVKQYDQLLSKV